MISFELPEDLAMIAKTAKDFAAEKIRPINRDAEASGAVPIDVAEAAAELGFGLVDLPEDAGGLGLGLTARVVVDEALAHGDIGVALGLGSSNAFAQFVLTLASDAQQASLLSAIAEGASGAVAWTDQKPQPGFLF